MLSVPAPLGRHQIAEFCVISLAWLFGAAQVLSSGLIGYGELSFLKLTALTLGGPIGVLMITWLYRIIRVALGLPASGAVEPSH